MGHFRLSHVPGGASRDIAMGVRMKRVAPGAENGEQRGQRTFTPPTPGGGGAACTPAFGSGWVIAMFPDPPDLAANWTFVVWPSSDTVLCVGDCLAWTHQVRDDGGASGAQPTVSIESAPDCVGVIANISGTSTPGANWTIALNATLAGQPFGPEVGFIYNPSGVPRGDFIFGGDHTSTSDCLSSGHSDCAFYPPATTPWTIECVYDGTIPGGSTFSWFVDTASFADWSYVEDTDGLGRPRITVTFVEAGNGYPEDALAVFQAEALVDGLPVDPAANAQIAYPGYP